MLTLIIAACSPLLALYVIRQNHLQFKQGREIKVHVDGKLDATIAEAKAAKTAALKMQKQLDATNKLVAALVADRDGKPIPTEIVEAAAVVVEAATKTDVPAAEI